MSKNIQNSTTGTGEHPKLPAEDWRYAVANEDTRLGYWPWVIAQIELVLGG